MCIEDHIWWCKHKSTKTMRLIQRIPKMKAVKEESQIWGGV